MMDKATSQQGSRTATPGNGNKVMLLLLVAMLIAFGIVGFLFLARIQTVEERVGEMGSRLDNALQRLEQVNAKAEVAESLAMQAGDDARVAARKRALAEASRDAFQQKAEQAERNAAEAHEEAQRAREEIRRIRREREAEIKRLQTALNKIADTRRTALGLVMNLGSDRIRFDFDKSDLKPENRELLSRIAGVLLTSHGYRVQIYGYTDDVGTAEYNLELSRRRAMAVRDYLVEAGIDPAILSTKGFGKSNPLVEGTTPQARAKNRRVEVGIIDTVIKYDRPVNVEDSENPTGARRN